MPMRPVTSASFRTPLQILPRSVRVSRISWTVSASIWIQPLSRMLMMSWRPPPTPRMEGVSRVLLAQITRHRLASFSVQSQRYVSYEKGFGYIVPPKIEALGEDAVAEFERQMDTMHEWYTGWQEKLGAGEGGNEDARFVLPGA